jgi:S-adenosylmethionine:tRNA ribosyltransferase-isomerase
LDGGLLAGDGLATARIGPKTELRLVDAILTGTHEPGTSHYELLRAFAADDTLTRANQEMETRNYTTHEFGDSVFIERKTS